MTAHAAGMPDSGTKNFVPGGDAPAYLTNENLAVAPGSAGQSPLGTAYNAAGRPGAGRGGAACRRDQDAAARQDQRGTSERVSRCGERQSPKTRSRRLARSRTERVGRSASLGRQQAADPSREQNSLGGEGPGPRDTARRMPVTPR